MRTDVYKAMASVEDNHWWFKGRRAIITHLLRGLNLPKGSEILDAGSGTGGNLAMLASFGHLYAMELDANARMFANRRGVVTVEAGDLPENIPFDGRSFDLIAMFDVLEHIEQDYTTLAALHARLKPQGRVILTVPAFELLWSMHDSMHHHKRRYSLAPLLRLLNRAGYSVAFASYINFWLFPVIAAVRILDRISGGKIIGKQPDGNAELSIPPSRVNRLLEKLFASEAFLLRFMRLPFGVSIVVIAEKA